MSHPDIRDLVPHSGPMLLVRRIVEHLEATTICEVDTADSHLFADGDGRLPAWLALEYMAQCAAAHGGLLARAAGRPPRAGMLIGTRRLSLHTDGFTADQLLLVSANCVHTSMQMLSFAAEVRDREGVKVLAAARINIHLFDPPEQQEP